MGYKLHNPQRRTSKHKELKDLQKEHQKTRDENALALSDEIRAKSKKVLVNALINGKKCQVEVSETLAAALDGKTYIYNEQNSANKTFNKNIQK